MTVKDIMAELRTKGSENIKKILLKHGVKEPLFGVKVEYLKQIQKKIKKDYQLAKDLFATGNADAMYLAGLIADDHKMTKADLQTWVQQARSLNISEYTVPWVAAEGQYGYELALRWIDHQQEDIAAAGWATLAAVVSLKKDTELDIANLKSLLSRVVENFTIAESRVRFTMNSFVIAAGVYVTALTDNALSAANKINNTPVRENQPIVHIPDAAAYILKIKDKGALGKKKKTVKC